MKESPRPESRPEIPYWKLFLVAADAMFVEDEHDNIVDANASACALLGYTREELLSMSVRDLLAPESRRPPGIVRAELDDYHGRPFESVDVTKDGTRIPVEVTNTRLESGGLILSVVRDIRERKRLEAAQRETHAIIEQSPMVVFIWKNEEGWPVEFVSANVERILGYTADDFQSGSIRYEGIVHEEDAERVAREVESNSAVPGRLEFAHEPYRIVKKDGSVCWVSDLTRIRRDPEDGRITHYQGVVFDITEQQRIEQELLTMEKLRSLGVLAGGIAHDFNNYLTGILGNLSLVRMEHEVEKLIAHPLHEMERATLRAKDLTQQLLTFSRGGSPVRKITDIAGLLRDCADFALSGSNVSVDLTMPDDLYPARVDPEQMAQVFNNLLINASQAMAAGGTVTVVAKNLHLEQQNVFSLGPGDYVTVGIRDHGSGIDPQNLRRVFDPYFTTREEGSGLGLAVAHSIITKHGGQLAVESRLGEGTEFTVVVAAHTEPVPQSETVVRATKSRLKVLIMDDEEFIRELTSRLLEALGHDVETAPHGEAALEIYQKAYAAGDPFDVVVLDLTVRGGMGGQETIERLIQIDPDVCAVVSSGYSNDPVMAKHTDYGFGAAVKKPYVSADLQAAISEALNPPSS